MTKSASSPVKSPKIKIYSFLNDVVFKWIFGQPVHSRNTICLLNALLMLTGRRQIKSVTILNPFNDREFKEDKLSVVDVKVQDHEGALYIVELQVLRDPNYVKRSTYYLAKLYTRQLRSGQSYEKLQPVTVISILGFNLFKRSEKIQEIFLFRNQEGTLSLEKTMALHYLDLTKFKEKKPRNLRTRFEKWLHVLKFGELYGKMDAELDEALKMEEGVEDMVKDLKKINADAEKRQLMETREKTRTVLKSIKNDSYSRGHKKGRAEGKIEGKTEGMAEIITRLHNGGRSIEDIATMTGLTPEEIKKLLVAG